MVQQSQEMMGLVQVQQAGAAVVCSACPSGWLSGFTGLYTLVGGRGGGGGRQIREEADWGEGGARVLLLCAPARVCCL